MGVKRFSMRALPAVALIPFAAHAQVAAPLVDTELPPIYDRGRNTSVVERRHPEFEALGINLGAFTAFPSVVVGVGETSNALVTQQDTRDDGFAVLRPRIALQSNWSVNSLRLDGGANLLRYFNNSVRNETGWNVAANGRYELTPDISIAALAQTQRLYETRFSSVTPLDTLGASAYQASIARVIGQVNFARSSLFVGGILNRLNYNSVRAFSGVVMNQDYRDRDVKTAAARWEYAFTPDTHAFTELSYSGTNYDEPLNATTANRESNEFSAVAGLGFDMDAPFRGRIAVGYQRRTFDAPIYRKASGVSVAGRLEYFPTQLTTVTLGIRRQIEDANVANTSAFFANSASLRVDHELFRYVILNLGGQYSIDDYVGIPGSVKIRSVQGGARYMLGHSVGLIADIRYSKRSSSVAALGADIAERRASLGIVLQR